MEIQTDGDWAFYSRLKIKGDVLVYQPGKIVGDGREARVLMVSYVSRYQGPKDVERAEPFTYWSEAEVDEMIDRLRQWRHKEFGPSGPEAVLGMAEYYADEARRKTEPQEPV